jgi:hypothetical protein
MRGLSVRFGSEGISQFMPRRDAPPKTMKKNPARSG